MSSETSTGPAADVADEQVTAVIYNDPEYSSIAMVERRRWRVALSNGRRRFTDTRKQAIEWCDEFGVPYEVLKQAPVEAASAE